MLSLFSFLQFYGSPWEYLQKEMQAVGEAKMKYMTYFGHVFTQGFMLRNGPSIFHLNI